MIEIVIDKSAKPFTVEVPLSVEEFDKLSKTLTDNPDIGLEVLSSKLLFKVPLTLEEGRRIVKFEIDPSEDPINALEPGIIKDKLLMELYDSVDPVVTKDYNLVVQGLTITDLPDTLLVGEVYTAKINNYYRRRLDLRVINLAPEVASIKSIGVDRLQIIPKAKGEISFEVRLMTPKKIESSGGTPNPNPNEKLSIWVRKESLDKFKVPSVYEKLIPWIHNVKDLVANAEVGKNLKLGDFGKTPLDHIETVLSSNRIGFIECGTDEDLNEGPGTADPEKPEPQDPSTPTEPEEPKKSNYKLSLVGTPHETYPGIVTELGLKLKVDSFEGEDPVDIKVEYKTVSSTNIHLFSKEETIRVTKSDVGKELPLKAKLLCKSSESSDSREIEIAFNSEPEKLTEETREFKVGIILVAPSEDAGPMFVKFDSEGLVTYNPDKGSDEFTSFEVTENEITVNSNYPSNPDPSTPKPPIRLGMNVTITAPDELKGEVRIPYVIDRIM